MRYIRDYLWAETPTQALEWVTTRPGRGAFLGGGTALATWRDAGLEYIVDLSRAGLDSIELLTDGAELGATLPLQRILEDPRLAGLGDGLLAAALGATRTDPWRRQATLAGRLLEGDPGDLVALALLALGASLGILRPGGVRPEWFDLAAGLELFRVPAPGWPPGRRRRIRAPCRGWSPR